MIRSPRDHRLRKTLWLVTIAAFVVSASPAWADFEQLAFTAGELRIISQTPNTHVRLVDLTTSATLDQVDLLQPGDLARLVELPDVVAIIANHPVLTVSGMLPSPRSDGGWSGFVPTPESNWTGRRFVTWADGDLIIVVPNPPEGLDGLSIEINDLSDGDDSAILGEADRLATHRRFSAFLVSDLDDDQIEITLSHPGTVQIMSDYEARTGWLVAPPSAEPGEESVGIVTGTLVAVQSSLAIVALHPDTEVEIIDWSDGDDSGSMVLQPGQIFTSVQPPGDMLEGFEAIVPDSPMDRDLIEVRASRPVAVLAGAFELLPSRGGVIASTPIAPGQHAAYTVAQPGDLHLLSAARSNIEIEALAADGLLGRPAQLAPHQWRGPGPFRAIIEIISEQIVRIESDEPFIAMSVGSSPGACCGPYIMPHLPSSQRQPPVAEAGEGLRVCPRQPFDLSGLDSFDSDLEGEGIVSWRWDLNLLRNTDGEGGLDDDIDTEEPEVTHLYATSGFYRARLTVEDDEGDSDSDEVEIQVLGPADPSCGGDPDNDGLGSFMDNCPDIANPDQADLDEDNVGDLCDLDGDGDNVEDDIDNCPRDPNSDQGDNDGDGAGDACDGDWDNDGVINALDNCPWGFNRDQRDVDNDGVGDICDRDIDGDNHTNNRDNCPNTPNPLQNDTDFDEQGDLCDPDDDGDGIADQRDNCQMVANPDQEDLNNNSIGDACERDRDLDAVPDHLDNCPDDHNTDQRNTDSDPPGDACDNDIDGDFFDNEIDNCPMVFNPRQEDSDNNGIGDICEPDLDGDSVPDSRDNCPETPNPNQDNLDLDGLGDACDDDLDGDGLSQEIERMIGTRTDHPDTDGDGLSDGREIEIDTDPTLWDTDGDGLGDGEEDMWGTDPTNVDTDADGISDSAEPGWNEDSDLDGAVNAADADSDNGGLNDGEEIAQGRNMLDPTDDILPEAPTPSGSTACGACNTPAAPPAAPPIVLLLMALAVVLWRR